MLGRLQDRRGEPRLRVRAMALVVLVLLVVLTAPVVMIPVLSWLLHVA